jgi:type III restriction enzyme
MSTGMKLKFKNQQFQEEAARAVVECFAGQPNRISKFTLDRGNASMQGMLNFDSNNGETVVFDNTGFKNNRIELTAQEVYENIVKVQRKNGLKVSDKLEGQYNLTIEMETGTGKTYTYIKTMFELNKAYSWNKFIVVVPSIAIREGVKKTFEITEVHFMEQYGKKIRYFVYNSKQLHKIDQFASDPGINVMIINSQAFASRGKDARRIYMELDDFQSRRPIDVIAQTKPILIIDEPQSVEGKKTKESLKLFEALFTLRYSATHKEEYNKIYRLDALDAYNKKLVKKINVKGITVKGSTGTDGYLYLEGVEISPKQPPVARLEFEVKTKSGVKKVLRKINVDDNLYELSGNLEEYKGYVVSDISGATSTIHFINGVSLSAGEAVGDVNESTFRRIQIRETIKSHLEKERKLFKRGIKVLSLFFIDEVAKYRQYDKDNNRLNGEYANIFEEEYKMALNEHMNLFDDQDYLQYIKSINVQETHNGYFSIDKQGKLIDPKAKGTEAVSDDVDAYELIMKDKEKLLSFSEPIRFIFSHSALREGWDNPNVFQICTLKHSDSNIKKRQEVGRGLRLCVNQNGERIDSTIPGVDVHDINVLTVVASESYESFAKGLQSEIAETLSDRPRKADLGFFLGKVVTNEKGEQLTINDSLARKIHNSFIRNNYLDDDDNLTDDYFQAVADDNVKLPGELINYRRSITELVSNIYSEKNNDLVNNDRNNNIKLDLNDNFYKKEFQELWRKINVKTAYTVSFDTDDLIANCVKELDKNLTVSDITYQIKDGIVEMKSKEDLEKGGGLQLKETKVDKVSTIVTSGIKYDLVGKLVDETQLTRKTIVKILTNIKPSTFFWFSRNPEEFIIKAAKIINEQKATAIIEQITYDVLNETYDVGIFTKGKANPAIALPVRKHVYDYVVTDSNTEKSFAKDLDASSEVCVYAKLPRGFFISTPMGNYNPDWAIVFNEGQVKHIYFVAETKGSLDSLELREIEKAKIDCARKHFAAISNNKVKYDVVDSYQRLMEIVK